MYEDRQWYSSRNSFCLALDLVRSLLFFQIYDRLPDQISSVVSGLVSGLVNFCSEKLIERIWSCSGRNHWRWMGLYLRWCVHIQACFQWTIFQNCYTATRCTSNESIYREALLICRYAGYRNYLEYRKVVEDDLDRMRKATDFMEMMFNPLIMLDNLDCSKAGFHRNLENRHIKIQAGLGNPDKVSLVSTINECGHSSRANCRLKEAMFITCKDQLTVALADHPSRDIGKVLVRRRSSWFTIAKVLYHPSFARLICFELGYHDGRLASGRFFR